MTRTPERKRAASRDEKIIVERVQTGVRLEKRLLKVLKGLAEYHDMTLGDLLEGIVLHAFDGRHPFGHETRQRIADLKRIYKLDLDADASHRLLEAESQQTKTTAKKTRKGGKGK
jgi:predicted DNA-binding ribbon-helix-helix protein